MAHKSNDNSETVVHKRPMNKGLSSPFPLLLCHGVYLDKVPDDFNDFRDKALPIKKHVRLYGILSARLRDASVN